MKLYLIFLLAFVPVLSFSKAQSFEKWKVNYSKRASKRGIPRAFIKKQLKNIIFNQEIINKDNKQITSNKKIDYNIWIKKWLRKDPTRINTAKRMMKTHAKLLSKIESKYNVDREVIISLWGVETLFGKITGDHDLISVLSTLAYKSRRKRFFEIQLNAALRMLLKGHTTRENLRGSWAGATGQLQFMPSNFNGFAKDFNKDGKKDIWNNHGDTFASIAYYLKKRGWKRGESIGRLVKANRSIASSKRAELPFLNSPDIIKGKNFKTMMGWNNSSLFAAFNIILIDALSKN